MEAALPSEIWQLILNFLTPHDAILLAPVSRRFQRLVWKRLGCLWLYDNDEELANASDHFQRFELIPCIKSIRALGSNSLTSLASFSNLTHLELRYKFLVVFVSHLRSRFLKSKDISSVMTFTSLKSIKIMKWLPLDGLGWTMTLKLDTHLARLAELPRKFCYKELFIVF